ncbi:MAG: hypothetical protein SchgKO_15790 [Schleiferiaceae bacterium]
MGQWGVFSILYVISTLWITPYVAEIYGRIPIEHNEHLKPANSLTTWLNRQYVTPELNEVLQEVSQRISKINSTAEIHYLDANFPFIDGFPLIPHLSHNDGKKVDLSLVYEDAKGHWSPLLKSRSGYGVFEIPVGDELNQPAICDQAGAKQYNLAAYLSLGEINTELKWSKKWTKELMVKLCTDPRIGKIFLEPHLVNRMDLHYHKIRFHGCHAVRHDDHIHIQLK